MKLVKLLQSQGVGSRKECTTLIKSKLVSMDGQIIKDPKCDVDPLLGFSINGDFWPYYEKVYVALYKPAGFECSHKPQHNRSVFELLPPYLLQRGVEAAGRLDVDTTGLLLLSDDGDFIHKLMSPKQLCEKVYGVTLKHAISAEACRQLVEGVMLRDGEELVKAQAVVQQFPTEVDLALTEGKYHQVKRMIAAVSNRVVSLHRKSVAGLKLSSLNLNVGEYCLLKKDQLENSELYDKCSIRI